ncbi:MAG: hypothetical protein Q9193_004696 [Seirophora villosa]
MASDFSASLPFLHAFVSPAHFVAAVTTLIALLITYGLGLVVYRIYFSPLASFPGPKLAACSQWYEGYYDLIANGGGKFPFHIKELHDRYGPIVRINPWELHIDDPDFYENIYGQSPSLDKLKSHENRFSTPYAAFSTPDSSLHRTRRAALNPFFSTRRIQSHEPLIQAKLSQICERLANEYVGKAKELTLNDLLGCLTADVIMEIAFGHSYNIGATKDFLHPFTTSTASVLRSAHVSTHMPWTVTLMEMLPETFLMAVSELLRPVIQIRRESMTQIRQILSDRQDKKVSTQKPTMFADILDSKLPPEEKTAIRLQNEAISLIGAGLETTKWTLTVAFYHILSDPAVHQKLREELEAAIPDPSAIPSWSDLQKLPYLYAGPPLPFSPLASLPTRSPLALRLSYGVVQRSTRVAPSTIPLRYKSYTIPPGTHISSDTYHMHHNEGVFPRSHTYDPARWLDNPKGPDGVKQLSRYMVAFSRGSRMCLGMQLASAEIFIALATLMRRFQWEICEGVEKEDVQFIRDFIIPVPRDGTRGVRVFVR